MKNKTHTLPAAEAMLYIQKSSVRTTRRTSWPINVTLRSLNGALCLIIHLAEDENAVLPFAFSVEDALSGDWEIL